jgi:hypothetical protein
MNKTNGQIFEAIELSKESQKDIYLGAALLRRPKKPLKTVCYTFY